MSCKCEDRKRAAEARLEELKTELSALGISSTDSVIRRAFNWFLLRRKEIKTPAFLEQLEKEEKK